VDVEAVSYLRQILTDPSGERIRLDLAALDLAAIQFPGLAFEPVLDRLNELASQLGDRLRNFNDGRDFVETAQRFLFGELGFHGNSEDYYDPLNSCLNQVLDRRTGIPISLSVLYLEVARRLMMPVFGIGLPRHFIVQYDDGNYQTFIDPYHGGKAISLRECFALAGAQTADLTLLERSSGQDILRRMVRNLHRGYMRRSDWPRAAETLDLLMLGVKAGSPGMSGLHKLRGMLSLELHRYQAARRDLETYLTLEPDATDREEIQKQLASIHRRLGRLN
jgi:regulator of sirC expression with transglutaminase-like and TPR domain